MVAGLGPRVPVVFQVDSNRASRGGIILGPCKVKMYKDFLCAFGTRVARK